MTAKADTPRLTLRELPGEAQEFIDDLAPVRSLNTCRTYRVALRRLYQWLQERGIAAHQMTRRDATAWLRHLNRQGLAPATRSVAVTTARLYLQYLESRGRLHVPADQLLSSRDLPKLPETLPRALRREDDHNLRKLLAASNNPLWLGLLLMRQTGLRVGELAALPYHCIRRDSPERSYLMVPVGKLNTERLVPIDNGVQEIIERIQTLGRQDRRNLVASRKRTSTTTRSIRRALAAAVENLDTKDDKPICTHRLRHAYATEMLNAGMSLGALKEILGHLDVNMTLRYAKPTLDLLSTEYVNATEATLEHYGLPQEPTSADVAETPAEILETLAHIIARNASEKSNSVQNKARCIVKRLYRIGGDLAKLDI